MKTKNDQYMVLGKLSNYLQKRDTPYLTLHFKNKCQMI